MKVLIACEASQTVCMAFRGLGVEAFSNDIQPCYGGYPEFHLQCDVFEIINDGWDLMIAHPECTHLAISGAPHFAKKQADGRQQRAIEFFLKIAHAPIERIAIENPIGIMGKIWRKHDQIIQPYFFGDAAQKTTCLWLKNLPKLYHNDKPNLFDSEVSHVDKGEFHYWIDGKTGIKKRQAKWYFDAFNIHGHDKDLRKKIRSKTFDGIARAMATQWTEYIQSQSIIS